MTAPQSSWDRAMVKQFAQVMRTSRWLHIRYGMSAYYWPVDVADYFLSGNDPMYWGA